MRQWYSKSIRNKLMAVVLLAVIPALLVASILSAIREAEYQRFSREAELQGIARALAAAASEPLASGDPSQVANALKGIGAIPGLSHASIRSPDGTTVFWFGSGIAATKPSANADVFSLESFAPSETEIRRGDEVIGRLFLIADISGVRDSLMRSVHAALVTALLAAIAGLAVSYRMQRAVVRPITELTRAMDVVRLAKDFTRTVARTSDDETGHLVETFNDMMREIHERDLALAEYREHLETLVDDRTRDLAEAVDAAQSANQAKSDFLATMSHEIRTPLNGILVMAELLANSDLTPRARRHCEIILRSGKILVAIVNDILDLSKIEAGQLSLEEIPVGPAVLVEDAIRLFSEAASSKGLHLAAYVAPDVPDTVLSDPVRLAQVLSNLVTNAIKFTETGGVLVEAEVPAAGVLRFSVTDTGIGIAEDKLASVFEPFTQAEQSTTRRFGGTGIGLTICRRLTSALGGTLTARSTLGQGSTFTFEIPFKTSGALVSRHTPTVTDPHDAPAKPETAGEFAGLRVLAADDSQINREVLFEALRRLGADVTFVEDGTDAVSAAATGVFDLVFMDGSMPGLDGFDATRQIRAWEAATCCRPLPIIGLSAHVIGEHAHAWTACGMSDFITKPFTLATIRDCLQRWTASSTAGNVAPVREDAGDRIVTAAAPAASLRIVDDSVLQSIRDMQAPGDDLVGRVVTLYLTHAPELLEQMMDCALRPDHPADLAAAAHALKSLSRNVGAIRVGDLCSIIEANARDGATPFAVDFAALQAALLATVAAFQTIAGGAGAPAAIVRTGEGFRT